MRGSDRSPPFLLACASCDTNGDLKKKRRNNKFWFPFLPYRSGYLELQRMLVWVVWCGVVHGKGSFEDEKTFFHAPIF
jgi:hypothetical protein